MSEVTDEARIAALAAHLGYEADAYSADAYQENLFTDGGAEYLVLTDEEADEAATEDVRQSLWAFNASWLAPWLNMPEVAIKAIQEQMYEDASDVFAKMLGDDFEDFADESIGADGRGHFLSGYDGDEIELGSNLYAYRVN
jgi:hypothetical protein